MVSLYDFMAIDRFRSMLRWCDVDRNVEVMNFESFFF